MSEVNELCKKCGAYWQCGCKDRPVYLVSMEIDQRDWKDEEWAERVIGNSDTPQTHLFAGADGLLYRRDGTLYTGQAVDSEPPLP